MLALGLGVVLVDLGLTLFAIRDGLFLGQPLPPFGAITHPRQRAWLDHAQREITGEVPPSGPGRFDAELGWTTVASYRSPDGQIASNATGARGPREYADEAPAGTLRVATFGDSFTYGDQVVDRATWQAVLERLHPELEVPNYGVGGYGTDQALMRYRRLRGRLDADVVIAGILLENIGRNVNRYRPLWYPKSRGAVAKPRFRLDGDALVLVPLPVDSRAQLVDEVGSGAILERLSPHEHWHERPRLGPFARSSLVRIAGAWWADRLREPKRLWNDPDGEPRRTTLALLETFCAEAVATGARALVIVFPREPDLLGAGDPPYWTDAFAELAGRGIAVLDVAPALVAARADDADRSDPEPLYRGGHLSPRGNAIVARAVSSWLRAEGLLR